jgi:hypothetical protein
MRRHRRIALLLLAAALFSVGEVVFASRLPRATQPVSATGRSKPANDGKRQLPFRVGEKLFYEIGYLSMPEAATAELKVMPHLDFYGHRAAWHFQAIAQTEEPLSYAMPLNDQFDSYDAASTLLTLQYELYLHERGVDSVRKLSLNENTPGADRVDVPAGTRDPLAALYAMRANNWQSRPLLRMPVYDGTNFYRMTARLTQTHGSVTVPAGTFSTSEISVKVTSLSTNEGMQFTLWLANNPAHTPVEVDAVVPIGVVKGLLLRVE